MGADANHLLEQERVAASERASSLDELRGRPAAVARAACVAAAAIAYAACNVVNFVLDVVAFIVELILSIPIIGGIIRTILNWVTEIVWRAVGLIDFLASLVGIRLRKKMYFGVIVPSVNSIPIVPDVDIQRQVECHLGDGHGAGGRDQSFLR
jgi:hypothetical protein